MELAIAGLIGYRQNTIVPNVSWGLGLRHECDMLVLDVNNRFTEIEIKISMSDLRADFKKGHNHSSNFISRLVYAFPDELLDRALPIIPDKCGIIVVKTVERFNTVIHIAEWYRQCKHDRTKQKPDQKMIEKFYHLGCMRIWSLKRHNNQITIK